MKTEQKQEWEIKRDNNNEQFKLLKKGAIKTSEGINDEWVASIYELEDFNEYLSQQEKAVREDTEIYYAYCSCGDSLERTGLYPNEAIYYCSGCDKSYKLSLLSEEQKEESQ